MRARLAAAVLLCLAGCTSGVATDPNPSNTPKANVLTVSPSSVTGTVGQQVTLAASVLDQSGHAMSGQTFAWSSTNATVATVSSAGVVSLTGVGSTTVSASADSLTTTVPVTVSAAAPGPVASVTVTPSSVSLATGTSTSLSAVAKDSSGAVVPTAAIGWVSSNTSVATVSTNGVVSALAVGAAVITASSNGKSGTASVTVTATTPSVASVSVSPISSSITVGKTVQLSATDKDAGGNVIGGYSVTWSSSNTAVATVSSSGLVSAVAAGSAVMTATSGGKSGTASVTVTAPPPPTVATVTVTPGSSTLAVGKTVQLTATDKDAGGNVITGQSVTWTSSNTAAATVSSSGLVSAVAAGAAVITASSGGKQGTASATVTSTSTASECSNPQPGWIWCDDFDTDRTASYFEYSSAGGNFVRQSGVGLNGSTGMHVHYVAGTNPDFGYLHVAVGKTPSSYFRSVDAGTANYRELYWRVYVYYPSTWTGGGAVKMSRAISVAKSDWSEAAFAQVWSGTSASSMNYLYNDPASGTDTLGNLVTVGYNDFAHMTWLGGTQSDTAIFDAAHVGRWYCIETHARLNDPGVKNGLQQLYINGHLSAQTTGMNWVGNFNAYGFNVVMLENYWNGGPTATEDRYFDNFVVSTQPIGCAPTGG